MYHIYVIIQTLCYAVQSGAPVHAVSIDRHWDGSATRLEFTCGKFKVVGHDLERPVSLRSLHVDSACQGKNQAMNSNGVLIDLRDRIVLRQNEGKFPKYRPA